MKQKEGEEENISPPFPSSRRSPSGEEAWERGSSARGLSRTSAAGPRRGGFSRCFPADDNEVHLCLINDALYLCVSVNAGRGACGLSHVDTPGVHAESLEKAWAII